MKKAAVLIVEEEALIRMESADIVKDAGFVALEARTADEAIRILAERSDIALSSLRLDYRVQSTG